ncbi:TPA: tyrosine--tRNA ligase [Candidatus Uhrbacteria bacterium]|uniref:Tyrosine--tRNA ligase n=2 Tax=Candidatus Uhriibacteriota TaxID=1752732 RepID=A0A0G1Q8C3_9BACT|nr:MAG: Tyrosyl-tRNA synthetase [Candidatus Uhrbacteria bacterium GW2011_GWF2_46_218]KKU41239.1 MAG: Tyrosyl-tRNA synthetase [Candidatus Uhrbacteria bacterium GW2011_GWE2_46_68]HBK34088.1 tyrosine--tRNA ligase [Candidatus Uhrbacteria bacterium]HCB19283.1 tyrosine--tRNA ligase [Candidatus Uhrbacteria bacterium]
MPIITDQERIHHLLTRGVEHVYPSREFLEARLKEGKPLTLYLGIDPTGPNLHMGHAIVLRKMREFQELGHKLILLIGDFTGMIGDPTDKSATRVRLTREQVLENAKNYQAQASKLILLEGENAAEVKYNSTWLGQMTFTDVVELASHFTVQQLLERDMFQKRMEEGRPIHLHEFLYPTMQGYDCVAMNVDGEIGGNDQTFNMLAGRDLMKDLKGREKFVVTMKLLVDPTGKKMGKSEGNMICLCDSADDMFGKVMSWTDGMIVPGFELCTFETDKEIQSIAVQLKEGINPRDLKAQLGRKVAEIYHGAEAAQAASDCFDQLFREHQSPREMPIFVINGEMNIVDLLVASKSVSSKTEARRLIDGKGIKVGDRVVETYEETVNPTKEGVILQKGKRHFVKIVLTQTT